MVIITETWLHDGIPDSLVDIPGYNLFRLDRASDHHGGVAIYVSTSLSGSNISAAPLAHLLVPTLEALWIKITIDDVTFVVAGVYRPPTRTTTTTPSDLLLFDALRRAELLDTTTLIFGDFNYPSVAWADGLPETEDSETSSASGFAKALGDTSFVQLIREPTRIRRGCDPSLLDLVLTNEPLLVSAPELHPNIGKSDHVVITTSIELMCHNTGPPDRQDSRLPFFAMDYAEVSAELQNIQPPPDGDLVAGYDELVDSFISVLRALAPSRTSRRCRAQRPWITAPILRSIRRKARLWKAYMSSNSPDSHRRYRAHCNKLTATIREARKQYESNIIAKGGKAFYAYLSKATISYSPIPSSMTKDGDEITDPQGIADAFAEEFAGVYTEEPAGALPGFSYPPTADSLSDVPFRIQDVEEILRSLDRSAASGPDDIPPIFLKECAGALAPILCALFRESLDSGTIPDVWRRAVVTPIHKKGSKHQLGNYRPISLTSTVCKVLERLVVKHVLNFARRTNIIPEQQHGFVPGRSITSNLLLCLEDWTKDLDVGRPVDVVYLDFSKAFDKVPHRRLLHKLQHLGIRGKLLAWIEAYLTGRTFQTRIGQTLSSPKAAPSGVPQGSVLGPLLFILYSSDLHQLTTSRHQTYADDNKIYGNPQTHGDSIQRDLDNLACWSQTWLIPLNPGKCSVLHLGKQELKRVYHLDGMPLSPTTSQVDLGVTITDNLKWGTHIAGVVKKVNSLLYRIRKAFVEIDPGLMKTIITTYVLPVIEFGSTTWAPYLRQDTVALERTLRRASKIPRSLRALSYEDRLRHLQLNSLEDRRRFADLTDTYRILRGLYDAPALSSIFLRAQTRRNLRGHAWKLNLGRSFKQQRRHSLGNRVVFDWNSLPADVVDADNIAAFKAKLRRHLFGTSPTPSD